MSGASCSLASLRICWSKEFPTAPGLGGVVYSRPQLAETKSGSSVQREERGHGGVGLAGGKGRDENPSSPSRFWPLPTPWRSAPSHKGLGDG